MAAGSQSEIAYQQIRDMILHMELLPGARIPELQISAKLALSRTPIHDALRRLANDGLVQVEPRRGAFVTCFTEKEIQQIGAIRLSQDILAIQMASYYGSASDFDRLDDLAVQCEEAAANGDIYQRIQMDKDFHLEVARISGNSRLIHLQYAIYQQIHLIQISKYTNIENSLIQIHHHKPIVEAIRNRDMTEAKRLTCNHVRDFHHVDDYLLRCYTGE